MYADRWPAFYEAQKYLSQLSHSEVDWKSMCLGPRIEDMRWGTCSWVCGMECLFLDTRWYLHAATRRYRHTLAGKFETLLEATLGGPR